jgi:hypothetical protein
MTIDIVNGHFFKFQKKPIEGSYEKVNKQKIKETARVLNFLYLRNWKRIYLLLKNDKF